MDKKWNAGRRILLANSCDNDLEKRRLRVQGQLVTLRRKYGLGSSVFEVDSDGFKGVTRSSFGTT